ncbi:hypothetical protein OIU77_014550 [Salix suchowensis]|uniref:Pentatricopeptide repeat-containing protein n=1 Tax=Salix suchowensis TaxID=1278906 RepID=A0ABQ8ZXM5_9ROSI|nr:hypothetical protein OIU77_014550 [Salix suchowensis]
MPNAGVSRDTSTYNSMIAIFCHHGHVSKALSLVKEMQTSALFNLDGQTFYPLLKSCLRTGDMDLLSQLLDDMVKKHQLSLDRSAYALLIHGLCRANKCEWAYHLFEEMIGASFSGELRLFFSFSSTYLSPPACGVAMAVEQEARSIMKLATCLTCDVKELFFRQTPAIILMRRFREWIWYLNSFIQYFLPQAIFKRMQMTMYMSFLGCFLDANWCHPLCEVNAS